MQVARAVEDILYAATQEEGEAALAAAVSALQLGNIGGGIDSTAAATAAADVGDTMIAGAAHSLPVQAAAVEGSENIAAADAGHINQDAAAAAAVAVVEESVLCAAPTEHDAMEHCGDPVLVEAVKVPEQVEGQKQAELDCPPSVQQEEKEQEAQEAQEAQE